MSLHVIVDGYNFINALPDLQALLAPELEAARAALISELACYRRLKGHQVTAVFDGRKAPVLGPTASRKTQSEGVSIVFSRRGEEADEVIGQMARRSGMRAVVVTADVELAARCRRWGAAVVSPEEFAGRMRLAEGAEGEESEGEEGAEPEEGGAKKGPARRAPRDERRQRLRKNKL
jgi:predicted RNA-binding protein with PIN domain